MGAPVCGIILDMTKHDSFYPHAPWRRKLYDIIFESDTPAGKAFDLVLLVSIIASVLVVSLESVRSLRESYWTLFVGLEWFFTILFTIEYVLRLLCARRPMRYAVSFFGIVDLISILPTYLSLLVPSSRYLIVIRVLRLLRVFRVLKLAHYLREAAVLRRALRASQQKITVFLLSVVTIVIIVGTAMYVVEGEEHGFSDIPTSVYWAIVTLTTVGYGDISPVTPAGKILASIVMLLGYGIIAVPTGIVTSELSRASQQQELDVRPCPVCEAIGHDKDAHYCKYCGEKLEET
jgi:voltage-gated potassium channel